MARHLKSSIDKLLQLQDDAMGELFEVDPDVFKRELKTRKMAGEYYYPMETCPTFDPQIGCCCEEHQHKSFSLKTQFCYN